MSATSDEAMLEAIREAMDAYRENLLRRLQTASRVLYGEILDTYRDHVLADVSQFLVEAQPYGDAHEA